MPLLKKLKKHRIEIIALLIIAVSYFALRFYNIMSLPIFTDEAIYVRWSQIARYDANWRFISLTDGKQPSFVWLTMTVMRFIGDPLFAGRLVSVFSGFGSLIGMYLLGREVFKNSRIGIISAFLYVIFPMALVYDKMALYDSLVGTFAVWSLYLCILLVRRVRLDVSLILGMAMGGGALTKTSAFFSIPLLFATYLLFDFKRKSWMPRLLSLIGFSLLSILIVFGFYSILRLSPFFHIINEKNSLFVYPLNEWLGHPFLYFVSNLRGIFDWLITYFTPPVLLLTFSSFLINKNFGKKELVTMVKIFIPFIFVILVLNFPGTMGYLKKAFNLEIQTIMPYIFAFIFSIAFFISYFNKDEFWKEKIILVVWFAIPFIYLAFLGRTIYPRFIFFMTLSLLPLLAFIIQRLNSSIKNRAVFAGLIIVIFAMFLRSDYLILTNFAKAPIPHSDYDQYINNWPAGGGIKEIITYLKKESEKGKIYVASLGTFGSLPTYAVEIYLGEDKNVEKRGIYPVPDTIPKDLLEKAKVMPVYVFVSNQKEFEIATANWPMTLIAQYKKGIGNAYSRLYRVNSK